MDERKSAQKIRERLGSVIFAINGLTTSTLCGSTNTPELASSICAF